ncbi:hypothetical protein [Pendulispora albinea]|uniref:NIPSNAP domain-containing protein n=1 Tax=Pendulispora albinea TaxID=2741071 RepID=A0ABZ2M9H0_9BACT
MTGTARAQTTASRPARSTVAQVAVWRPKSGQEQHFENGYKQHLQWHKTNGDTWSWYGWYVVSGPRYGQFIDATFDHAWSDFDKAVNPAEDRADNGLHTVPFGDVQTIYKIALVPELSIGQTGGLTSKLVRLITLSVLDTEGATQVLARLRAQYQNKQDTQDKQGLTSFLVYRLVDGGDANQVQLLLGFGSQEEYGKSESIFRDIRALEHGAKVKAFAGMTSETLVYRADMSLFPR